jgi:S1-C subfamily serine protease
MSDESPRDERPGHDAPVDEGAPTDETAPATEEAGAQPPPPPAGRPKRNGVFVPRWAAFVAAAVVAVLVLFFGGFAIGRVTAGDGDHEGRDHRTEHEFPGRRGGGNEGPGAPRPTSGVFLGVATRDATGDVKGAEVVNVASGSPAAQAGLQTGDVITAVDGSTVTSAPDLAQKVRSHQSGDQVTITYSRGGNSAQAQVTLGNRSPAGTPSA